MKTTATAEQIAAVLAAMDKINVQPFRQESGEPKYNAQRNLGGKTHYVDDGTLQFHKSRITSTTHLCGGLLFKITGSDALDSNNTRRGFRCVVFDLFGETVWRPELDAAKRTEEQAQAECAKAEFDVVAHYRTKLAELIERKTKEAAELQSALAAI